MIIIGQMHWSLGRLAVRTPIQEDGDTRGAGWLEYACLEYANPGSPRLAICAWCPFGDSFLAGNALATCSLTLARLN
jgi:hypothetical protein